MKDLSAFSFLSARLGLPVKVTPEKNREAGFRPEVLRGKSFAHTDCFGVHVSAAASGATGQWIECFCVFETCQASRGCQGGFSFPLSPPTPPARGLCGSAWPL